MFNIINPDPIKIPINTVQLLNPETFFNELKSRVGNDIATELKSKLTIKLDDNDTLKYENFRERISLSEKRNLSDFDILRVTRAFGKKELFDKYLAQVVQTYKLNDTSKTNNATKEQKPGFTTGDNLAQNIQSNPVTDPASKETQTGFTFNTVPDVGQSHTQQQQSTTHNQSLNDIIYGTGGANNQQYQDNQNQGKRPWCKYMLDTASDTYFREKFAQLGRTDYDKVSSTLKQVLRNKAVIDAIYDVTRETTIIFGLRSVTDANNFSFWGYINNDTEVAICDFLNGELNINKQPVNQ